MKRWTLKFLAGAVALFLTIAPAPVEADLDDTSVTAAAHCGPDGCRPAPAWVCVIRWGADCEEAEVFQNKCPLGNAACDNLGGGEPPE